MTDDDAQLDEPDDWRERPCARCGDPDPSYTSPEWNLCASCNRYLRERYGNV